VLKEALAFQKNQRDQQEYQKQLEEELASHEADIAGTGLTKDRLKVFFRIMDSNPALISESTVFKDPDKPLELKKPDKDNEISDEALLERTDTFVTHIAPDRLSNPDKSFYQDPAPESSQQKRSESMENLGPRVLVEEDTAEDLKDIIGLETDRTFPKIDNTKKKKRRNKSVSTFG
jgi:hypothetical protein